MNGANHHSNLMEKLQIVSNCNGERQTNTIHNHVDLKLSVINEPNESFLNGGTDAKSITDDETLTKLGTLEVSNNETNMVSSITQSHSSINIEEERLGDSNSNIDTLEVSNNETNMVRSITQSHSSINFEEERLGYSNSNSQLANVREQIETDITNNEHDNISFDDKITDNTKIKVLDITNDSATSVKVNESPIKEYKNINASASKLQKLRRSKKITMMFLVITLLFFITFVPHLVVQLIVFIQPNFLTNSSFSVKVVYHVVYNFAFINSVANCYIYGFFDAKFRTELKKIYKRW
jgi:hypothetical protein